MEKHIQYAALVNARKACRRCDGMRNPSVLKEGRFDSDQIGPWTKWLGDLNASVMVIGQEWGDGNAFLAQSGRDSSTSATNIMLRELLGSMGIEVPAVDNPSDQCGVFLTNAALCMKDNGCQAPVQDSWFRVCGQTFLRPQIELVQPRIVIALGQRAFMAVRGAYGQSSPSRFRDAVDGPSLVLPNGSLLFAVYHCGQRILNTHRKRAQQFADWQRIGEAVRSGGKRVRSIFLEG